MIRRRGFTLIEIIVVFASTSIVLLVGVGLIHVLMRLDRAGRAAVTEAATLSRLAREFRRDVRAATGLGPIPFATGPEAWLPLTLPGGRVVEYRGRRGALIRTERTAEEVARTETYRLPPGVSARWEVERPGDRTLIGLVLEPEAGQASGTVTAGYRIEGIVGADHRFARPGG